MEEQTIKNELAKYNVTDAAIAKLNADYMALAVKGVDDKAGYEVVKAARIDIKKRRVEVEKTRVTLKRKASNTVAGLTERPRGLRRCLNPSKPT